MDLSDFKKSNDWTQIWAGGWSLLSCSNFGDQYTKEIIFGDKPFLNQSIIFVSQGRSSGWARQKDKDILGKFLSSEIRNNPEKATEICESLKREVDLTLTFMDYHSKQGGIDKQTYQSFWNRILVYYKPHINIKYIVDYLEPALLEKYLPQFEEARLYAESVFKHSEDFVQKVANQIAQASGYTTELILCLTKNELLAYFDTGSLPPKEVLCERNNKAALLFDTIGSEIFISDSVTEIEQITSSYVVKETIKGSSAYAGKVVGVVKVIFDPKFSDIKKGEILVTGMTRPEYLPLMKKASAIVTDAGGILSHAAITARELKIPCVIGTQIATKILKDGDRIEVDGEKGVITILNT